MSLWGGDQEFSQSALLAGQYLVFTGYTGTPGAREREREAIPNKRHFVSQVHCVLAGIPGAQVVGKICPIRREHSSVKD